MFVRLVKSFAEAKGIIHGDLQLYAAVTETLGSGFDPRDSGRLRASLFETKERVVERQKAEVSLSASEHIVLTWQGWELVTGLHSNYASKVPIVLCIIA